MKNALFELCQAEQMDGAGYGWDKGNARHWVLEEKKGYKRYKGIGGRSGQALTPALGDIKLLEATATHLEIFPRRGGSKSTFAKELYAGILGGKKLNRLEEEKEGCCSA